MNVSLTPELEEFVHNRVQSGRYTSASEVVREALRALEEREQLRTVQLAEFNRELERRIAAMDRGEGISGEEARGWIDEYIAKRKKQRA